MRDHMLLTMVYTVYHYPSVGRAVVFNLIGELFEFAVRQHLFGNLYQQIFQYVFKNDYEFGFEF